MGGRIDDRIVSHFEVGTILWAGNRDDHFNHLHVEPPSIFIGYIDGRGEQPPGFNPGRTSPLNNIFDGLIERFGTPAYYLDTGIAKPDWYHMGWYNHRNIGGSKRWSQHAWANAIDIGPYYGVEQQRKFFDFLTGKEQHMSYERIAGYDWYDTDKWGQFDVSIRRAIVAGIIHGKSTYRSARYVGRPGWGNRNGRYFDPRGSVTRAQLVTILDRVDVI